MEKLTFEQLPKAVENLAIELQEIKKLIQQILDNNPRNEEEVLTVQEAASFLSLSVPTIYSMISKREIPVMKRSKRCYFLKTELTQYLKFGRKKTMVELDLESENYKG